MKKTNNDEGDNYAVNNDELSFSGFWYIRGTLSNYQGRLQMLTSPMDNINEEIILNTGTDRKAGILDIQLLRFEDANMGLYFVLSAHEPTSIFVFNNLKDRPLAKLLLKRVKSISSFCVSKEFLTVIDHQSKELIQISSKVFYDQIIDLCFDLKFSDEIYNTFKQPTDIEQISINEYLISTISESLNSDVRICNLLNSNKIGNTSFFIWCENSNICYIAKLEDSKLITRRTDLGLSKDLFDNLQISSVDALNGEFFLSDKNSGRILKITPSKLDFIGKPIFGDGRPIVDFQEGRIGNPSCVKLFSFARYFKPDYSTSLFEKQSYKEILKGASEDEDEDEFLKRLSAMYGKHAAQVYSNQFFIVLIPNKQIAVTYDLHSNQLSPFIGSLPQDLQKTIPLKPYNLLNFEFSEYQKVTLGIEGNLMFWSPHKDKILVLDAFVNETQRQKAKHFKLSDDMS